MTRRTLALTATAVLLFGACSGGGGTAAPGTTAAGPASVAPTTASTPAPAASTAAPAETSAAPAETSAAPATSAPAGAFDPNSVSGDLKLAGFSAGNVEDKILQTVLDKFMAKYPKIKVKFEVIAGEYGPVMLTRLGSGNAPDLFYVQQGYSQDWIKQGVLLPLDDLAKERGFDTSHFYPGFLAPFQADGKTYGFPKDASILGMETNDALLTKAGIKPPTTVDELDAAAAKLKGMPGLKAPLCFSNEFARAGAFVNSYGGGMLTADGSAPAIDSPQSKAALEWYLGEFQKGQAGRPSDIGVDWCGQALGEQKAAIAFEGNWIGPYMDQNFPTVKYTVGAIPKKDKPATLSFTAAYAMSPDSPNKDASWVLLSYLTGAEGMQEWVNGGLVLPSRDDVHAKNDRQKAYVAFAPDAAPGEGLLPGWSKVADAFNGALGTAIDAAKGGKVDAGPIIAATKPALAEAIAGK